MLRTRVVRPPDKLPLMIATECRSRPSIIEASRPDLRSTQLTKKDLSISRVVPITDCNVGHLAKPSVGGLGLSGPRSAWRDGPHGGSGSFSLVGLSCVGHQIRRVNKKPSAGNSGQRGGQ